MQQVSIVADFPLQAVLFDQSAVAKKREEGFHYRSHSTCQPITADLGTLRSTEQLTSRISGHSHFCLGAPQSWNTTRARRVYPPVPGTRHPLDENLFLLRRISLVLLRVNKKATENLRKDDPQR